MSLQIFPQQVLPPKARGNILHARAHFYLPNETITSCCCSFYLTSQWEAFFFCGSVACSIAAASTRPVSVRPSSSVGSVACSSSSSSASRNVITSAITGATTMTFSYPNFPGNGTRYLVILQNGAYQIPIPAYVGAATTSKGTHPQAVPFFQWINFILLECESFTVSATITTINIDTTRPTRSSKSKYFQWLLIIPEAFAESAA
uniref:Uncharacterized protein n=1 Tax=Populus alba TaxID=43335 RepID=A0A4U5QX98_POPAL|nr:hypothetical protein D5086_0000029280 [Populus alba]